MYFDIHTSIGHWPFRKLQDDTAPKLKRLLKSKDIEGSAVGSINGVFYMNCQDANLELAEAIEGHRDFFTGVATLNPCYAAWERDLEYCVKTLKFRALRLFPKYHNYDINCDEAVAIAKAAASYGIPVIIPQVIIDCRQKHWMDLESFVDTADLGKLCLTVPKGKFIVTEFRYRGALVDDAGKPLYPNLYIETSRLGSAYGQELSTLANTLGSDHLLFGSGAPFKGPSHAILRIECAKLSDKDKLKISALNAKKLLGL